MDKNENAYLRPKKIETGYNDHEDKQQLDFLYDAVGAESGKRGTVPGWHSSSITVNPDDDNFSSVIAKLLIATDGLEIVLKDLGVPEEAIEQIKNGEQRWAADTKDENLALKEAVASHLASLDEVVLKGGTKFAGKKDDYSKVQDIIERSDGISFEAEDEDSEEPESSGESEGTEL